MHSDHEYSYTRYGENSVLVAAGFVALLVATVTVSALIWLAAVIWQ